MKQVREKDILIKSIIIFALLFFISLVFLLHFIITKQSLFPIYFLGYKNYAVLDLWSVQHFIFGIFFGSILNFFKLFSELNMFKKFLFFVFIAFAWEIIELTMEAGLFGEVVANWKAGYEFWANRLIADPLLVVSGGMIGKTYKNIWKFFLVPVFLWFLLNICFPNCMYIQGFIFG